MKTPFRAGKSPILVFVWSAAAGLAASLLLLSLFAYILTKKDVSPSLLPVFLLVSGFFGSLLSAFISTKKTKKRGMIAGVVSGLIFSGVFLLICYVLSGLSGSIKMLLLVPVALVGGLLGGLAAKNLR